MDKSIDIKYVYLNSNLEIVDANREFYVYFDSVGHDLTTIDSFVAPASRRSLISLINSQRKRKDKNYSVLKLLWNQRIPKFNIVQAYGSMFKGEKTTCLKIIDVEQMLDCLREENIEDTELVYALSLMDDCIFSYWQSSNVIKITQFYHNKRIVLYDIDIDDWQRNSIQRNIVPESQVEVFNAFVDDLKSCGKEVSASFISGIRTSNPNILEKLTFSGIRFVDDGEIAVVGRIMPQEDVAKAQRAKKIIEEIQIDPLTKIYNKKTITSYAQKTIDEQRDDSVALIMMDLDHFKPVNDAFGHLAGDKVLARTGDILRDIVGDRGIVGRYGGDEFLILVYGITTEQVLRGFLHSILIKIRDAFRGKFEEINITCSLGCSVYPKDGKTYDELFQKADFGLYRAKDKGRNRYVFFREDLHGELYKKAVQAKSGIKYDDREVQELKYMADFMQKLSVSRKDAIDSILQHMIEVYNLDNVSIFYGEGLKLARSWGKVLPEHRDAGYVRLDAFKNLLGHGSYVRVDFMGNVPSEDQFFREAMEKCGIKSTVQCILGVPEKITGLVTFNRTKTNSLWAEYEVNCASLFASAINLLCINGGFSI